MELSHSAVLASLYAEVGLKIVIFTHSTPDHFRKSNSWLPADVYFITSSPELEGKLHYCLFIPAQHLHILPQDNRWSKEIAGFLERVDPTKQALLADCLVSMCQTQGTSFDRKLCVLASVDARWASWEEKSCGSLILQAAGCMDHCVCDPTVDDFLAHCQDRNITGRVVVSPQRPGQYGNNGSTYLVYDRPSDLQKADLAGATSTRVQPFVEGVGLCLFGVITEDTIYLFLDALALVLTVLVRVPLTSKSRFACIGYVFPVLLDSSDKLLVKETGLRAATHFQTLGYRGAFDLDGVLAKEKFVVTEINPRPPGWFHTPELDFLDLIARNNVPCPNIEEIVAKTRSKYRNMGQMDLYFPFQSLAQVVVNDLQSNNLYRHLVRLGATFGDLNSASGLIERCGRDHALIFLEGESLSFHKKRWDKISTNVQKCYVLQFIRLVLREAGCQTRDPLSEDFFYG